MSDIQAKLRARAKELLESGKVGYVVGWGAGRLPGRTAPKFVFKAGDADQLVWNKHCTHGLAKYLLDDKYPEKKIALCVRGCDSRAVNRLLKDGAFLRENLYLLGIPCPGVQNPDGAEAEKCQLCSHPNPLVYDELLGEEAPARSPGAKRFAAIDEMEALSADERYGFWAGQYDKCIRCYACRNVCPACSCVECYADQYRTGWQGKQHNRAENQVFGLTRAFHVGDRCIECGECERVCPMGLPLMKLNRKMVKDVNELFGDYEGGLDAEQAPALGTYLMDDLEEFM